MAVIEMEMVSDVFGQFVRGVAQRGPIPTGTVKGLGQSRLIAAFRWGQVDVGPAPPGFNAPPGVLTARCSVALQHISIAELDANPNATGNTMPVIAWITITATATNLQIHMIAIQVPNTPLEWYTPKILVAWRNVPDIADARIISAAMVLKDEVVTLRFGTRMSDNLLTTPANLVRGVDQQWAIHIPGDFFAEKVLDALNHAMEKPPPGTTVEDTPEASWEFHDDAWVAIGSVGLEKKDACPAILGDVDVSVTVDVVLTPSATTTPPNPRLNMTLGFNSNASDYDSFRCWLGNGFVGSAFLGYFSTPIIGSAAGEASFLIGALLSLIAVAETVRLQAADELNEQNFDNFTLASSSGTSATYSGSLALPSLVQSTGSGLSNGTINGADVGSFGMLISGTIIPFGADHQVSFIPNGGALSSRLKNKYDCGRKSWYRLAEVLPILITDTANPVGEDPVVNQVKVFPTSTAVPANLWTVEIPPPDISQYVTIKSSRSVKPGDTGRVYLHTSADLRRFDINALPEIAAPSPHQEFLAVAACLNHSKVFQPQEKIRWLPDPVPFVLHIDPIRQWLFTFARLAETSQLSVYQLRDNVRDKNPLHFTATRPGSASFEMLTDASTEILVEHKHENIGEGRILQRWINPVHVIDIGEPGLSLVRSGSLLIISQSNGIYTFDLSSARGKRQVGEFRLSKISKGGYELVQQTRKVLSGVTRVAGQKNYGLPQKEDDYQRKKDRQTSFSLTLPGGRVAALFENKLIIGVPSESMVYGE
jgi:hypothetical protein